MLFERGFDMLSDKRFRYYYFTVLLIVAALSVYPVMMGVRVISNMIVRGYVSVDNYPKYVIPYTPISLAVIVGTLLMPIVLQRSKKALPLASVIAIAVFLLSEVLMEKYILVRSMEPSLYSDPVVLESWQLGLCIVQPGSMQVEVWEAVDKLLGGYSQSFKVHFYVISLVLILTMLNCFYGFGAMIFSDDRIRRKPLVMQACATATFLGMCIWACFSAFYRTGGIRVAPVSAVLMGVFFVLFGLTFGIYVASFTVGQRTTLSVKLPSVLACLMTLLMYIGETVMLNGRVYRFGKGFFFDGLGSFVLAPVDILIILFSGFCCYLILMRLHRHHNFQTRQAVETESCDIM